MGRTELLLALVSMSLVPGYSFIALNGVGSSCASMRGNIGSLGGALQMMENDEGDASSSRRAFFSKSALSVVGSVAAFNGLVLPVGVANAGQKLTGAGDGNLPDLPPDAARSYLQYRIPLQISADSYVWEIQKQLANIDDWGLVNQNFQTNNNRGQGQPNKIERDYTNVMRILGLSFPPDEADAMRDAQFAFEKAMAKITKITKGVRRDLSVEIDPNDVKLVKQAWDEGRVALNDFFKILNDSTGLNEMRLIPPAGPNQDKEYGRSQSRFNVLIKKTKLCQNRGGPALSQAWGQLMISGYMQDSCGIPDLDDYFFQKS